MLRDGQVCTPRCSLYIASPAGCVPAAVHTLALHTIKALEQAAAAADWLVRRAVVHIEAACDVQGFLIQTFALATVFWTFCITYNLYGWVSSS